MTEFPTQPILSAIDAIYASAQEPDQWNLALDRIASAAGAVGATLGYVEFGQINVELAKSTVFSQDTIGYYVRELAPTDPLTPVIARAPVGKTMLSHEALDVRTWTDSRMYAELYEPRAMLHAMAGAFARQRDAFGTLLLTQERGGRRFERDQAQVVDLLLPHIARSMQVSQLLAATYLEAEAGRYAAVFLDHGGEVLAVGPRAQALLRQTARLTVRDRRVRSSDTQVDQWLAHVSAGERGDALPERALDLVAHGGPCWLDDGEATVRLEAAPCPEPLVSWTAPGGPPTTVLLLDRRTLAASLPASLSAIAELVAEGLADKQIAQRTGRPLSTVRTYVARLFRRAGVSSRAEFTKWWWTNGST